MNMVLLALLLFPVTAAAQSLTAEDFLRRASEDTIADVEAGRLAQGTAQVAPPVQQLGRQISGEAMTVNDRVVKLAAERGVPLANQIPAGDRHALDRMAKLQGGAFTREYLRYVLDDLERDRAFYQVATALDDPVVAQFARDSLPAIEKDLQVARALYDSQVAAMPSAR